MVSFEISDQDKFHLDRVLDRAEARGLIGDDEGRMSASMDLHATHANGCPLDFQRFAEADDFNFLHDFRGIARHLDRGTGKLTGHFLPRFHRREVDNE